MTLLIAAGAGGRRADDGRLHGAAGRHGARRRDGADHQQQPGRAAGVAQHDDGGHAVRGHSGGQRQHRRELLHPRRGGGPGHGDADGDGTRASRRRRARRRSATSGLQLSGVPASTTTLSPDDGVLGEHRRAECVRRRSRSIQALRAGAPSVTVTVSHTNTGGGAAGHDERGRARSRTVTIAAGQSIRRRTVAAGGVAFDPIGGGSTTVSATAAGFRAAAPVTVTVSAPGITLLNLPTAVGAGLQDGCRRRRLGASAHGGVTVRITSSESQPAAGFAQRDDGGRRVHRRPGGQRQYRRDLFRAGSGRCAGHRDAHA